MKKLLKYITVIAVTIIALHSCDYDDTNFDNLHQDPDPNATYFVQFKNTSKSLETTINEVTGNPDDAVASIDIAILGTPISEDLTVSISVDPSSTIEADMYQLSATSLTIPAGKTSGALTVSTVAENMPEGESFKIVINLDAGEHDATSGMQLTYSMKRIKFCNWSVDDMVGTYTGTDDDPYYGGTVSGAKFEVFKIDDTHIAVSGIMQALYSDAWGEKVTGGDRVEFFYKANGGFTTENQYLCQTEDVWDYYFGPSEKAIKWDGCTQTITIPYYFHWDDAYGDTMAGLSVMTKD